MDIVVDHFFYGVVQRRVCSNKLKLGRALNRFNRNMAQYVLQTDFPVIANIVALSKLLWIACGMWTEKNVVELNASKHDVGRCKNRRIQLCLLVPYVCRRDRIVSHYSKRAVYRSVSIDGEDASRRWHDMIRRKLFKEFNNRRIILLEGNV